MKLCRVWQELMPGGVNSPVRAFKSVGGQPIVMDSVKGCRMRDIDGNEYIDYVGSWGPAIIGHADDTVLRCCSNSAFNCIFYPLMVFYNYLLVRVFVFLIVSHFLEVPGFNPFVFF